MGINAGIFYCSGMPVKALQKEKGLNDICVRECVKNGETALLGQFWRIKSV